MKTQTPNFPPARTFHCGASNYADDFRDPDSQLFAADRLTTRSVLHIVVHCHRRPPTTIPRQSGSRASLSQSQSPSPQLQPQPQPQPQPQLQSRESSPRSFASTSESRSSSPSSSDEDGNANERAEEYWLRMLHQAPCPVSTTVPLCHNRVYIPIYMHTKMRNLKMPKYVVACHPSTVVVAAFVRAQLLCLFGSRLACVLLAGWLAGCLSISTFLVYKLLLSDLGSVGCQRECNMTCHLCSNPFAA